MDSRGPGWSRQVVGKEGRHQEARARPRSGIRSWRSWTSPKLLCTEESEWMNGSNFSNQFGQRQDGDRLIVARLTGKPRAADERSNFGRSQRCLGRRQSIAFCRTMDFDRSVGKCCFHESGQNHAPIATLTRTNGVEKTDNHRGQLLLKREQMLINGLAVSV